MIKKYVTTPKEVPVESKSSGMSKGKVALIVFLLAAFFVGTGYGVYVMSMPSNNTSAVAMTVNDSAFPIINNTTNSTGNNTSITNITTTKTTSTTKKSTSTTKGTSTKTGNSTG